MTESETSNSSWYQEDQRTRALISLASGLGLPTGTRVEGGLVELSRRHGLTSLLAKESKEPVVLAVHARQQVRQGVMQRELLRILARLAHADVRTAVLKGSAVGRYYSDPTMRPYSDLDLLVEEASLETALEVLASDEHVTEIPPRGPKAAKRDVVAVDPTGVRFNVDLHWDLFSYSQFRGRAAGAIDMAWQDATRFEDDQLGTRWELPQPYELAFLAAHAVLDHRFRLILFRDFLEIVRNTDVDWDEMVRVTGLWGLQSTTYLAFWISRGALGVDVPSSFLDEIRPNSLALSYLEHAIPRLDIVRFDGHEAHPVNLASVLIADEFTDRLALTVRAPGAFPKWKRRVAEEHDEVSEAHPRTLIVVSTNRRRGAEVFTERLRDALTFKGWVVDAVALRGAREGSRARVDYLIEEDDSPGRRFEWKVLSALRRKLKSYRPDVIVANGGATLRYSLAARIGLGAKVAYIGIGEPSYWTRSPISKLMNRFLLRRADKILAVSEATRRQLALLEPSTADKTTTAFTGLTEEAFDVRRTEHQGPLRVVMVGSLTPEKDPRLALEAVAGSERSLLRFVGDGPLRDDLIDAVADLGVSERVEFVGSVDDVSPHLAWGDVLILTSRTEGLPGAILEAGAAGLAIVAVGVGGVAEAVRNGETGFVTKRDVGELSGALGKLDRDRDLLQSMGAAGREFIASRFLMGDVVETYRRALKDLVV